MKQDPMKQMECYTTQNHLKECESCKLFNTISADTLFSYIEERTAIGNGDSFREVKERFGYDPTYLIDGKLYRPGTLRNVKSSAFSKFFRTASYKEKEEVSREVAQKSSEEQKKVIDSMKEWDNIEENYKKLVKEFGWKSINDIEFNVIDDTLAFFKPYFPEKLHQEAKEELEQIKL